MIFSVIAFLHFGYFMVNMLEERTTNILCHENLSKDTCLSAAVIVRATCDNTKQSALCPRTLFSLCIWYDAQSKNGLSS
jgi:hypothetical protein